MVLEEVHLYILESRLRAERDQDLLFQLMMHLFHIHHFELDDEESVRILLEILQVARMRIRISHYNTFNMLLLSWKFNLKKFMFQFFWKLKNFFCFSSRIEDKLKLENFIFQFPL